MSDILLNNQLSERSFHTVRRSNDPVCDILERVSYKNSAADICYDLECIGCEYIRLLGYVTRRCTFPKSGKTVPESRLETSMVSGNGV